MISSALTPVLVVDDDPAVRRALIRCLERDVYICYEAGNGDEALSVMEQVDFPLVITDLRMPDRDGRALLRTVREQHPRTAVVILSADSEVGTAVACLNDGASDYLTKPFHVGEVSARVRQSLEKRRLRLDNDAYHSHLEERIAESTRRVEEMFLTGVQSLVRALEVKDPYTRGHSERVAAWAASTSRELGLDDDTVRQIELGANLHDLGKIGVREDVLCKSGPLTHEEYEHVMEHTVLGWRILAPLLRDAPMALEIVRSHHERYDGRGRPEGLRGDAIPLGARIVTIADAFDVMTTGRPYKENGRMLSTEEGLLELRRNTMTQFDPVIVRAFGIVTDREARMSA
ncbi:MAG TPA: HD domain-containing phosphohydrolase [Gemmatimonadaceae bacterium]|nr:HD domain-containing phosphohydrolase [Gemmatimonadaceae bacterium]